MSGRMVNTNKFWCISFAANRERFSFLFVFFFFVLFLSLFRLVLCYRASHPSLSVEIFSTYLSTSIHLFHHLSLLLSTSFIISLSYYPPLSSSSLSYYPPLSSSLSLIIIFLMPLFLFVSAAIVILWC